jgi:hypothetical protein
MTDHTGKADIVYVRDGKEFSAREACLKALAQGGEYLDMTRANMSDTLARYGFEEKKKTLLRRIRAAIKGWIRARLVAIGKLERHFA